jgi:magnesium-transporting ATPase (P-type)
MQNMIKPATPIVLNELANANITSVMVTGDNLHTAINVARHCGLVPQEDRIIIVEAYPPSNESGDATSINSNFVPARIEWKLVENTENIDTCGETSTRHDIVRFNKIMIIICFP